MRRAQTDGKKKQLDKMQHGLQQTPLTSRNVKILSARGQSQRLFAENSSTVHSSAKANRMKRNETKT